MVNKEVRPVLVGRGPVFAEGITFGQDGTLYCVDVEGEGGGIWRMPPGGELAEWVRTGGHPNGSRFGPHGDLYVADCGHGAILRIETATAAIAVYAEGYAGERFRGPNDLCFGPDGTLYCTDPAGSSPQYPIGTVYAVVPDGTVTRVATGLAFPNGIAVTPDGTTLIVAETHTGLLRCYSLRAERRYEELRPLAMLSPARPSDATGENDAGPDGMVFGADGNLYVAHYNGGVIRVIAPDGREVRTLPAGGPTPTNVAFWQDSLYVTEGLSGAVYRLDIGVREQPPFMRLW